MCNRLIENMNGLITTNISWGSPIRRQLNIKSLVKAWLLRKAHSSSKNETILECYHEHKVNISKKNNLRVPGAQTWHTSECTFLTEKRKFLCEITSTLEEGYISKKIALSASQNSVYIISQLLLSIHSFSFISTIISCVIALSGTGIMKWVS